MIIGYYPDYLPGPDIITHPGPGVEKSVMLGIDNLVLVDPDRVCLELRLAGKHPEISHDIQDAGHVGGNGLFLNPSQVTGLGGDGWLFSDYGGVAQVLGVFEVLSPGIVYDDVLEAKGQGHFPGDGVKLPVPAQHPVGIGNQGLVAVPAVHID